MQTKTRISEDHILQFPCRSCCCEANHILLCGSRFLCRLLVLYCWLRSTTTKNMCLISSSYLSLNRWGTTDDFATSFLHFSLFSTALWDLPNNIPCCCLPTSSSVLSSSPIHCALQDGFGQTWWTENMTKPLQFASLYDGQEVFLWSDCFPSTESTQCT